MLRLTCPKPPIHATCVIIYKLQEYCHTARVHASLLVCTFVIVEEALDHPKVGRVAVEGLPHGLLDDGVLELYHSTSLHQDVQVAENHKQVAEHGRWDVGELRVPAVNNTLKPPSE